MTTLAADQKRCSKCGATKALDAFFRNRSRKDGLHPWCRQCCRAAYVGRRPPGSRRNSYPSTRNELRPPPANKRCPTCGQLKPISEFRAHRAFPDGRTPRCSECLRGFAREYGRKRREDPEFRKRRSLANRRWYERRREVRLSTGRERYELLRADVLRAYGSTCACCGETTPEFLGVDHTNGGGNEHRRRLGITSGQNFYLWLKRQGFPKDGFRLLCHNCNTARGHRGVCPHERRTE